MFVDFKRNGVARAEITFGEPGGPAKLMRGHATFRVVVLILFVVACGVTALFVYKISQTSSWALQFDDRVKESVGIWALSVIALWACSVILGVLAWMNRGVLEEARANQIGKLRRKLAEIATGGDPDFEGENQRERVTLESRLRELGA